MKKELKIINRHFLFLDKQLSWLLKAKPCGLTLKEIRPLLDTLRSVFTNRGLSQGLLYIKAVRGNYLNSLSGNLARFEGVRVTKEGLPICFGPLLRHFRVISSRETTAEQAVLQLINTILFSTRALKTKANPDLSPIVSPSKRGTLHIGLTMFVRDFWKLFGYRHSWVIPRALKFRRFHFTTKTGPNGHALGTWWYDLLSLPYKLREAICILGGDRIQEFMSMALGLRGISEDLVWDGVHKLQAVNWSPTAWQDLVNPNESGCGGPGYFRRLTYFPDKEGKTRVIAILDYFSQTVLKGLHSYLFRFLRKIPQDMTFDQGAFTERIKTWPVLYSVDLSAATDRFPIQVIKAVLRGHLPASYVNAWEHIMIGYPFHFANGGPTDQFDQPIRYSVGNPMGAYSSWASFALAHHYIFYYIARRLNKDFMSLRYVLLGDDILIGDEEVAQMYLEIIQDLGVDVSLAKTHVSKNTCEFAKRWFHRGLEISPFPISALKNCGKKYYFLVALLMNMEGKGWEWGPGISKVVADFYGKVVERPARFRAGVERRAYTTEQIMKMIRGAEPGHCMNNIVAKLGHTELYFNDQMALQMLSNIAVELFSRSMPDVKKGKPLGLIAEELVLFITGLLEEIPAAMTLLENPTLHAYGSIEQRYLDLLKMAREIDVERQGEWPLLLRAMTIPLSDNLFLDRQEATEALGVSQIGRLLTDRIGIVKQYPSLMDIEMSMYPPAEGSGEPEEKGILDPLTSTKEEVQKLTGLSPHQQLDPSNFLNQEFSNKRSTKLPKPGSTIFKPALKMDRATYAKGWLWSVLGILDPKLDSTKSGTSSPNKPTGPSYRSKISWAQTERNRRMYMWCLRHPTSPMADFILSSKQALLAFVDEQADREVALNWRRIRARRAWSPERRIARFQKPVSLRRWIWIERCVEQAVLNKYGLLRGILVIAGGWLLYVARFVRSLWTK